jgi:NADPH-dependent ferric siderophore reductase
MNQMDYGTARESTQERTSALVKTVRRWVMRSARISSVTALSDRFRLIELRGDALKGVAWTPGDKIQVAIGSGFTRRTYTPISWDATVGTTRLLVYLHGGGAGSQWASDLQPGDLCDFSGPRKSLDVSVLASDTILFGDETSFALAAAAAAAATATATATATAYSGMRQGETHCVFEVDDTVAAQAVIDRLGLRDASVIERQPAGVHHDVLFKRLAGFLSDDADFILTGQASAIRYLHHSLKLGGLPASRLRVKAYWAQGKTGLD